MGRTPTKIGKYPVEDKIAEGGMGAVYKGTHPTLEQPVVLKKLTLNNSDHLTERFRREAKIMIEFSHENIVRVYDHFKQASSYYIVQEFVDGCSVDILLKKERYLDINTGLYIFYHACKALQYAHNRQVIHRDIKPANIMVSKNGEIKLVDFGIAQADSEEEELTKDGMTLGTPSYMAPEQFEDSKNVTCQADIYSLGVMLYEMLTGKKPFPGKINPETILKIQKGRYVNPKKLQPEIPGFAVSLIRSCMQAQLKKRPQSIAVLMKKLDRWYQGAPVEQIRQDIVALMNDEAGHTRVGQYKTGRKKMKLAVAGAVLILLLAGGSFAYLKGMHYRYLQCSKFGAIQIQLEIEKPLKKGGDMNIVTHLFKDDNITIPDIDGEMRYKIREENEGHLLVESDVRYLEPGTYRIKTTIDNQVIWTNIYLEAMKTEGSFFDFGDIRHINMSWSSYRPLPLSIEMKARERGTGKDLSDTALVSILKDNVYVPLEAVADKLETDNVYKIRVSAEGYHSNDYHLRIQPYQTSLQLDVQLVPKEGFLRINGWNPLIRFRINGKKTVLSGGFPGELTALDIWGETGTPLALSPGDYILSFQYKGEPEDYQITVVQDETIVFNMNLDEKEKTLTVEKE